MMGRIRAWLQRCWTQPDRMLAYYRRVWWPDDDVDPKEIRP